MLAVDFDQSGREFRQLRGVGHAAVDPCLRSAIGAQHAAQQAAFALVHFLFGKPGARLRGIGQVELGVQFGAIGPVADHAGIRALA